MYVCKLGQSLSDDIFDSEVKAKEGMIMIFDIDGVLDGGSAPTTSTSTCTC